MKGLGDGLARLSFLLVLLFGLAPAAASPAEAPFVVRWTQGVCRTCRTATGLASVQFVSPREAWAVGYRRPGETGAGDYSVLHSRDGGKTWTELPDSYEHNEAPGLSFANRREGWLLVADMPAAEQRLLQTRDGGRHWLRLAPRDLALRGVQNLGHGVGFAYGSGGDGQPGSLWITMDHGRHWKKRRLADGFDVDRMQFVNARRGLLVGCQGRQVVVLRTLNGGRRWTATPIDLPRSAPESGGCDFWADDLSLQADGRGWLVINKRGFANNDKAALAEALQTSDLGATWTPALRKAFGEPTSKDPASSAKELVEAAPTFTAAGALDAQTSVVTGGGGLWASSHQGSDWQAFPLAHPIAACRIYAGAWTCAAGTDREFWVAKIGPAK